MLRIAQLLISYDVDWQIMYRAQDLDHHFLSSQHTHKLGS